MILNPEIAENECYADFTTSHDELEKIMGVNGTAPKFPKAFKALMDFISPKKL